jgi:hypothetical protein
MITLIVGDVSAYLAQAAQQISPHAKIITQENHADITDGTYYISLGDFVSLQDFIETLDKAENLIYCPPKKWSDGTNSGSKMKYWTEHYLMHFLNYKNVIHNNQLSFMSAEKSTMLSLADLRKSHDSQLWISGCSISHGVGVEQNQRFGKLLADLVNLPVSFLTKAGSSIQWAADQILRSDIRRDDIVVWGLTSMARVPYYSDGEIKHIVPQSYEKNLQLHKIIPIERLDDDNMTYQNLVKIHAVINFCQKVQAKLFLFGMIIDYDSIQWMADLPEYTQLNGRFGFLQHAKFLDLGTDGVHPGPLMHQWYCDQMFATIQKRLGTR